MKTFANIIGLAALLSLGAAEFSKVGLDMFHDGDCKNQFMSITVNVNTCYHMPVGFQSYRINHDGDGKSGSKITVYTKGDCGCPTCGSRGAYSTGRDCRKNFGFVANAVGYLSTSNLLGEIFQIGEAAGHSKPPKRSENGTVAEDFHPDFDLEMVNAHLEIGDAFADYDAEDDHDE